MLLSVFFFPFFSAVRLNCIIGIALSICVSHIHHIHTSKAREIELKRYNNGIEKKRRKRRMIPAHWLNEFILQSAIELKIKIKKKISKNRNGNKKSNNNNKIINAQFAYQMNYGQLFACYRSFEH